MKESRFFYNTVILKIQSISVYALVNIAPEQFTLSLCVSILYVISVKEILKHWFPIYTSTAVILVKDKVSSGNRVSDVID